MNFFVAVTDYDWFQLHASKPSVVEVNFWRPSPEASFKALEPGEMLLFKLHSPHNFIVVFVNLIWPLLIFSFGPTFW